MTEYIYHQAIVNYRVPIKEDGKLGTPEIVGKFIREYKQSYTKPKKAVKKTIDLKVDKVEEGYL